MPQRFSYVGDLGPDGALDWRGPAGGNIPGRRLAEVGDLELYLTIARLATADRYEGRTPDWDAYVIKVNGPELNTVLLEAFAKSPQRLTEEPLTQYVAFAQTLGSQRYVALAAVAF